MPKRKTTEEFIADAIKVHGNKYDYSRVNYVNNNTKVEVICPIHGSFFVLPRIHLNGCECPRCKGVNSDQEYFIERAKKIHNDKYDYSKVEYKKANQKVCIICKRCGREFWQTPNSHLRGHGCKCYAKEAISKASRAEKVYGVGVNDYKGFIVDGNGKYLPSYSAWMHMLRRCYNDEYRAENQTYKNCKVCGEWLSYNNFKEWFDDEANGYKEGYELDKDIKVHYNKEYSPQTCLIVPRFINTLFVKSDKSRGEFLIGVNRTSSGRFSADITENNKDIHLGTFDTEIEAFIAYKKEKERYIKEVAEEYYSKHLIVKDVHDSMIRYEVMEDD